MLKSTQVQKQIIFLINKIITKLFNSRSVIFQKKIDPKICPQNSMYLKNKIRLILISLQILKIKMIYLLIFFYSTCDDVSIFLSCCPPNVHRPKVCWFRCLYSLTVTIFFFGSFTHKCYLKICLRFLAELDAIFQ